jgi:carbon-monoxide dehydrogenase medium subunit
MCTPQTRTIATVGGNLCHAAPSADLSPLLLALDAEAVLAAPTGERSISLEDFIRGPNETALADDEILVEVRVPLPTRRREACYRRVARTSVDIALTGVAVALTSDGEGRIADARIALCAVAPVPLRSRAAEEVLVGAELSTFDGALSAAAGERAAADARPITDLRASAEYRREMVRVLTRRAICEVVGKLAGGAA